MHVVSVDCSIHVAGGQDAGLQYVQQFYLPLPERLCPAGLRDLVASTAGMDLLPGSHLQELQDGQAQEQQHLREHGQVQEQSEPAGPSLDYKLAEGLEDEKYYPSGCVLPPGVPHIQEAPPPMGEQGTQQPPRKRQRAEWVRDAFMRQEGAPQNQATCCYCNQDLSTLNVSRMKSHLLNRKVFFAGLTNSILTLTCHWTRHYALWLYSRVIRTATSHNPGRRRCAPT